MHSKFQLASGKIAKSTQHAGWWDIYSSANCKVYPGVICFVPTGIVSICEPGIRMRYSEKSGMSAAGFDLTGGCIDSDYTKEWFVLLRFLMPSHLDKEVFGKKQWANVESILGKGFIDVPSGTAVCQFKFELIIDGEIEIGADIGAFIDVADATRTGGFGEMTAKRELAEYVKHELLLQDVNFKRLSIGIPCRWTYEFNGYLNVWDGDIEAFTIFLFESGFHTAKIKDCVAL